MRIFWCRGTSGIRVWVTRVRCSALLSDALGRDSRHGLALTASQARAYVLLMTYKAAAEMLQPRSRRRRNRNRKESECVRGHVSIPFRFWICALPRRCKSEKRKQIYGLMLGFIYFIFCLSVSSFRTLLSGALCCFNFACTVNLCALRSDMRCVLAQQVPRFTFFLFVP